jgi:hypothetical protein
MEVSSRPLSSRFVQNEGSLERMRMVVGHPSRSRRKFVRRTSRQTSHPDSHSRLTSATPESGSLRRRNVFNARNVQNSAASRMRDETLGIWIQADLDGVAKNPGTVMVFDIVEVAARHPDAKRTKGLLFHAILKLVRREHGESLGRTCPCDKRPVSSFWMPTGKRDASQPARQRHALRGRRVNRWDCSARCCQARSPDR